MLNLVPIQFLALFAYALLRIVVGLVWCQLAIRHYRYRSQFNFIKPGQKNLFLVIVGLEFIAGVLFILGAWTQIAALLTATWCLIWLGGRRWLSPVWFTDRMIVVLLLTISLSLFITGAGVLAFDLPI